MIERNKYSLAIIGFAILFMISMGFLTQPESFVTGKVFPAGLPTPMQDVMVKIEGIDSSAVLTNEGGVFKIGIEHFPVNLEFSKDTYKTQVKTVKKDSDITVQMIVK